MSYRVFSLLSRLLLCSAVIVLTLTVSGCSDFLNPPVTISGVSYPYDTENVVLSEYDSDDFSPFSRLKHLKSLDVTALSLSPEDYERIHSQLDSNVTVIWSVPMNGRTVPSNALELSVAGAISEEDAHNIEYFSGLTTLSVTDTEIDENLANFLTAVSEHNPDIQLNCSAKIYGVSIDNTMQLLDLNAVPVPSPDQLCLAIELFPNIKTIEMCDCGLSNQIMQGLREEYPEITFVWTIYVLNNKIRTDAQVFSTLVNNFSKPGNTETFLPIFRYCTELRALDLGHMAIDDISEIRNLKKLHTLILADNYISDITPLTELKDLVYVELFQNRIQDVSPLLELPNLEDLNLCYNGRMQNPTVLTGCAKLKRLYISYCSLDANEIAQLRNGIPSDCEFNYTAPNCVFSGWRTTANVRNTKIREAFKNWRNVKEYPTWDNIIYK